MNYNQGQGTAEAAFMASCFSAEDVFSVIPPESVESAMAEIEANTDVDSLWLTHSEQEIVFDECENLTDPQPQVSASCETTVNNVAANFPHCSIILVNGESSSQGIDVNPHPQVMPMQSLQPTSIAIGGEEDQASAILDRLVSSKISNCCEPRRSVISASVIQQNMTLYNQLTAPKKQHSFETQKLSQERWFQCPNPSIPQTNSSNPEAEQCPSMAQSDTGSSEQTSNSSQNPTSTNSGTGGTSTDFPRRNENSAGNHTIEIPIRIGIPSQGTNINIYIYIGT